jgi:hypothetical protein
VRRSVYCTASFSVCSRRRTELPIIYADFRLDYKLATLPLESKKMVIIKGGQPWSRRQCFWASV